MNRTPLQGVEAVRSVVELALDPRARSTAPGRIGLEVEHLPIRIDGRGRPSGRPSVAELAALLDDDPSLRSHQPGPGQPGWVTSSGARWLPEPGGQLELAGQPHGSLAAALAEVDLATADLARYLDDRGIALASAGLDVWHQPGTVAQGLTAPRYPAMHTYLGRRSPHGHVMMTCSASIQVNLDLGATRALAASRWSTALLAAPLATASFACSPVPGAVSGRAVAWQWLDRTRTGIPPAFVDGVDDPTEVLTRQALEADVLLFTVSGPDGTTTTVPGEPGFAFGTWLAEGHPAHGRPTAGDLATHLTTLFPEVRLRGSLEVRGVDALPERWRAVPAVLYAGLLYDDRARESVASLMTVHRPALPELLRRAAHLGVADPQLCALAVETWTAAAEGARRLPAGWVDEADIRRAERFLDAFTLRGRTPADELRDRLARGPATALRWAREPIPEMAAC